MPRSFDDVVAEVTAAEQGEPAPAPTPGDAQPASAADIDGGEGAREPAAGDARMGTEPVAREDGGSTAEGPHPPPGDELLQQKLSDEVEALKRQHVAETAGQVVDPISGEVIDLGTIATDALAGYVDTLARFLESATEWRHAGQDELRKRLGRDKVRAFGDWEVAAVSGRQRKWDAEDLREAVSRLMDLDVLKTEDVQGLITAGEPKVNGTLAAQLLQRVRAEHRPELESCFTWERKGRDSVRVTRMASLAPPGA